ncbi:TetR/AcrR family transcriptional regulator [Mycobacterium sp. NPDC003449]
MAERADAARNRQAVLDAAGRLFDDAADPGGVSMDDVARAAGVGKGTLFRRFGDRAGLLRAVYDARLAGLTAQIDSGSPPLGPGAGAADRIPALLDAIVDFKLDNRRLALALEQDQSGGAATLYGAPHYVATHQLLTELLTEVIGPEDASWTAYALLGATRIDLVDYLVTTEKVSRRRLRADLRRFVSRVLGASHRS